MAASNPDAFKSVAADGLNSYADYSNITPDMYDDPTKQNDFIEAFIQNTLNGAQNAAANGKQAKINNQKESARVNDYMTYANQIRNNGGGNPRIPMRNVTNQYLKPIGNNKYIVVDQGGTKILAFNGKELSIDEALKLSGYSNY
jgi:hypothetical protein